MENIVASHWKLTGTNWEPSWKLILVQLYEKLPRNSTSTVLWSLGIWSKLKRWKSSINGCLMSWPQIKKNCHFEVSSSLILCNNNEQFLNQIVTVNFIQQLMTSSVTGPERSSKALPKGKPALRKGDGHCLVVCCWSDPLQLSEFWGNHYIWEVCSANWWDALKTAMPAAGTGQQKGPSSSQQRPATGHTTSTSKVERIGLQSFASYLIFTWSFVKGLLLLQAS